MKSDKRNSADSKTAAPPQSAQEPRQASVDEKGTREPSDGEKGAREPSDGEERPDMSSPVQTPGKRTRKRRRSSSRAVNGAGTLVKHGKYYHARWMVDGTLISRSLKTADIEEAREKLARLSVPRAGQEDRVVLRKIASVMSATLTDVADAQRVASLPLRDLFALFRDAPNREPVAPRTLEAYHGQFNVLTGWIGRNHPHLTNIRDVSQAIADAYVAWRRAASSPNTVNKDLNLFAQAWRLLSVRYGLEYNPWTEEHIARLKLAPVRRRNLTAQEVSAVLELATLEQRAAIELALYAAFRLGDVVRMTWSCVDFAGRWITKLQHKTARVASVPIADPLLETLKAWRKQVPQDEPHVFPGLFARLRADGDTENISESFSRLFRRAGIKTSEKTASGRLTPLATFHSLRHTFVTNLMAAGVNPLLVKEAAGHSVMATTAGYTHIGEDTLRRALNSAAAVQQTKKPGGREQAAGQNGK